jgi:hypothetical protein
MNLSTELPFTRPPSMTPTHARLDPQFEPECDRCGRPVHRETSVEQEDEALLCTECEFGSD